MSTTLHMFYDDDSEEYWVAADLSDLRNAIDEAQGPGAFVENYGDNETTWGQLSDGVRKAIRFKHSEMATEDDEPEDCYVLTKTWGSWAKWNGRGYFGGGRG